KEGKNVERERGVQASGYKLQVTGVEEQRVSGIQAASRKLQARDSSSPLAMSDVQLAINEGVRGGLEVHSTGVAAKRSTEYSRSTASPVFNSNDEFKSSISAGEAASPSAEKLLGLISQNGHGKIESASSPEKFELPQGGYREEQKTNTASSPLSNQDSIFWPDRVSIKMYKLLGLYDGIAIAGDVIIVERGLLGLLKLSRSANIHITVDDNGRFDFARGRIVRNALLELKEALPVLTQKGYRRLVATVAGNTKKSIIARLVGDDTHKGLGFERRPPTFLQKLGMLADSWWRGEKVDTLLVKELYGSFVTANPSKAAVVSGNFDVASSPNTEIHWSHKAASNKGKQNGLGTAINAMAPPAYVLSSGFNANGHRIVIQPFNASEVVSDDVIREKLGLMAEQVTGKEGYLGSIEPQDRKIVQAEQVSGEFLQRSLNQVFESLENIIRNRHIGNKWAETARDEFAYRGQIKLYASEHCPWTAARLIESDSLGRTVNSVVILQQSFHGYAAQLFQNHERVVSIILGRVPAIYEKEEFSLFVMDTAIRMMAAVLFHELFHVEPAAVELQKVGEKDLARELAVAQFWRDMEFHWVTFVNLSKDDSRLPRVSKIQDKDYHGNAYLENLKVIRSKDKEISQSLGVRLDFLLDGYFRVLNDIVHQASTAESKIKGRAYKRLERRAHTQWKIYLRQQKEIDDEIAGLRAEIQQETHAETRAALEKEIAELGEEGEELKHLALSYRPDFYATDQQIQEAARIGRVMLPLRRLQNVWVQAVEKEIRKLQREERLFVLTQEKANRLIFTAMAEKAQLELLIDTGEKKISEVAGGSGIASLSERAAATFIVSSPASSLSAGRNIPPAAFYEDLAGNERAKGKKEVADLLVLLSKGLMVFELNAEAKAAAASEEGYDEEKWNRGILAKREFQKLEIEIILELIDLYEGQPDHKAGVDAQLEEIEHIVQEKALIVQESTLNVVKPDATAADLKAQFAQFGIFMEEGRLNFQNVTSGPYAVDGWVEERMHPIVEDVTELPEVTLIYPLSAVEELPALDDGEMHRSSNGVFLAMILWEGEPRPAVIKKTNKSINVFLRDELIAAQVLSAYGRGPQFYGVLRRKDVPTEKDVLGEKAVLGYAMAMVLGKVQNAPVNIPLLQDTGLLSGHEGMLKVDDDEAGAREEFSEVVIIDAGDVKVTNEQKLSAFISEHNQKVSGSSRVEAASPARLAESSPKRTEGFVATDNAQLRVRGESFIANKAGFRGAGLVSSSSAEYEVAQGRPSAVADEVSSSDKVGETDEARLPAPATLIQPSAISHQLSANKVAGSSPSEVASRMRASRATDLGGNRMAGQLLGSTISPRAPPASALASSSASATKHNDPSSIFKIAFHFALLILASKITLWTGLTAGLMFSFLPSTIVMIAVFLLWKDFTVGKGNREYFYYYGKAFEVEKEKLLALHRMYEEQKKDAQKKQAPEESSFISEALSHQGTKLALAAVGLAIVASAALLGVIVPVRYYVYGAVIGYLAPYLFKVLLDFFWNYHRIDNAWQQYLKDNVNNPELLNSDSFKTLYAQIKKETKTASYTLKTKLLQTAAALPVLTGTVKFFIGRLQILFLGSLVADALTALLFGTFDVNLLNLFGLQFVNIYTDKILSLNLQGLFHIAVIVFMLKIISRGFIDLRNGIQAQLSRVRDTSLNAQFIYRGLVDKKLDAGKVRFFAERNLINYRGMQGLRHMINEELESIALAPITERIAGYIHYYLIPAAIALTFILTSPIAGLLRLMPIISKQALAAHPYYKLWIDKGKEFWKSFWYMWIINAEIGAVIGAGDFFANHPILKHIGGIELGEIAKLLEDPNKGAISWGRHAQTAISDVLGIDLGYQLYHALGGGMSEFKWAALHGDLRQFSDQLSKIVELLMGKEAIKPKMEKLQMSKENLEAIVARAIIDNVNGTIPGESILDDTDNIDVEKAARVLEEEVALHLAITLDQAENREQTVAQAQPTP
ncbi:MAG: hypothetical protein PHQ96_08390, partial [Candidatus Omnitrophica bacterium]|nr:hypothetical protein [Candidatus Omnitrophota bacterium]